MPSWSCGGRTESFPSDARRRQRVGWALVVALDRLSLAAWPERFGLTGLGEVELARGAARRLAAAGGRARLELPDRWISSLHARLERDGERWIIVDLGSRNGTRVNGTRVERHPLADGDVIEVGGTTLVLRRSDRALASGPPLGERPEALRTLSVGLEHELDVLRKVARSPLSVLVCGESGTGKEGIANAVHALSGRDGPIVAVNCGAIPATLVESELFGSRRGAFSGAEERPGLIRAAEGGTLFLDEVTEMPMSSQAALLRVLQEKQLLPLGAGRAVPVDVRVVAATNRPVGQLVADGRLRRDLYARLRGYELRLPPLRERREDLGMLVATLIRRHDGAGKQRTLSRAAAAALFAHDWPLNIRELEQCLSAALAVAGAEIDLGDLPPAVRDAQAAPRPASPSERERIAGLIRDHDGNLSAVARALATSRSQLYRLLTRHALRPGEVRPGDTPEATPATTVPLHER